MGGKLRVAQLAQDGASDKQAMAFNAATGEWEIVTPIQFGLDAQFVEELERTTTTLAFPGVNKLTMVVPAQTGLYRVAWSAIVDNVKKIGEFRLNDITGSPFLLHGPVTFKSDSASDFQQVGGTVQVNFSGAAKTFAIQFNDVAGGNVQGIQQAHLAIWKVGT